MKNVLGGICVGIANIIPGVSGGTILVLLGLFDKIMESITKIFSIKTTFKEKLNNIWFLLQIIIGVGIGLVCFAKILEFLFVKFPNQTLFWFVGLILFSIPVLKKKEIPNTKINYIFFIIGIVLIGLLVYFNPKSEEVIVPLSELLSKTIDFKYIMLMIILGIISGATMIFPGVSGSMVLLVLGYYHLFKGYIANVTSFELQVLIPLVFISIGIGIGIVLSGFITNYLLKNHKNKTMSLIFGLIIMSAITIIPTSGYNLVVIITSILSFLFGGAVVLLIEKMSKIKA